MVYIKSIHCSWLASDTGRAPGPAHRVHLTIWVAKQLDDLSDLTDGCARGFYTLGTLEVCF